MDIHFFAKSDIGRVRTANEDYFLNEKISDTEFLFIVADGMGGHQAGDVASKLASETFSETYRGLRKKGTPIPASMELAVRKANTVVFRKAAADIEKRGMGTTFSALVIAGMKAHVAHVGDSRIYLIRRNRIKRITTDHSFVEKLVEEGRISADEARDHPQKNVLYMSLGARESFTPEIQNDIVLEDGDALVMCSDGLTNMLDDETLMNITLGDYPEEAADTMVKLANAHGGTDNITVQLVRIGSLETMEKTKPIRLSKPRGKLVSLIALLVLLAILAGLWYVFFHSNRPGADAAGGMVAPAARTRPNKAPSITEIDASRLNGQGVTAADCRFLSGRKLHVLQQNRLNVFSLDGPSMLSIELAADEQVVPCLGGEIHLLRREPTQALSYQLVRQATKKTLLRIQHDEQLLSKESQPDNVSLYRIAGLRGRIIPDYLDDRVFIFHDLDHYYEIANWQSPQSLPAMIEGLAAADDARLVFKNVDGMMTMLYHDAASGRAVLFGIHGRVEKVREYPQLKLPQPLLLEYVDERMLIGYFADQCQEIRGGRLEASHAYFFNNYQVRAVKVMVDMADGQKLVVNDGNKFFYLACEP